MKRILVILAMMTIGFTVLAQDRNSIYSFYNAGSPKDIQKLGTDPEFPFLRNLSTSRQV